jgi:hypothetical protein
MPCEDGEIVFWAPFGFFRAHELREIADELDRRNAQNDVDQMDRDLEADITAEMHRYVFERATPEIAEDGCCSGSSPCPVKSPGPRPGAVTRDSGVFCRYCSSRLNKQTPTNCPDCGKDLTK